MANIPNYEGFPVGGDDDQLRYAWQAGMPRGRHNEHYKAEPDAGGGSTRPTAGQAWPRGNTRGNG
jgi:hypothetical protein